MRRKLQSIVASSMRATIQARDQQSIHYEHCAFLFLDRFPDLDRRPKLKKADVSASAGGGVCSGYPDSADLHTPSPQSRRCPTKSTFQFNFLQGG